MAVTTTFHYGQELQRFLITEQDFYKQNPQHNRLASGAVIFDGQSRVLLVKRAKEEKAFPNFWEIPGGRVDGCDASILHAVAREVKEETGLEVRRFARFVGQFGWEEAHQGRQRHKCWRKLIFEVEVEQGDVVLDPAEHQAYLFASEAEVVADSAGGVALTWVSPVNKEMVLDAFRRSKSGGVVVDEGAGGRVGVDHGGAGGSSS